MKCPLLCGSVLRVLCANKVRRHNHIIGIDQRAVDGDMDRSPLDQRSDAVMSAEVFERLNIRFDTLLWAGRPHTTARRLLSADALSGFQEPIPSSTTVQPPITSSLTRCLSRNTCASPG